MIRTICGLGLLAIGLLGFSSDAHADYLVLCPTGGINASWETTGGFGDTGPFQVAGQRELQLEATRTLRCDVFPGFSASFSYPSAGPDDCGGTVEFLGFSAVFGRNEIFSSGKLETEAIGGDLACVLNAPSAYTISMTMSEACVPLSAGSNGWICPDSAQQLTAP